MTHFAFLSPEEAADLIENGQTIALGGFTPAGSVKVVTKALADRARREHSAGNPFRLRVISGASTDEMVDGALAEAEAISYRVPYQTNAALRKAINSGQVEFLDLHLSTFSDQLKLSIFGEIDVAIFEASEIRPNGEILLTSAVGATPTLARKAKKILIELNDYHRVGLEGLHDIYEIPLPPERGAIPLCKPSERIGRAWMSVDPSKIVGVVKTNCPDSSRPFSQLADVTQKIGQNLAEFFVKEMALGRIPRSFLPLQAGVGNVSNALLSELFSHPGIPPFEMYSELLQDTVIAGLESGRIRFASGSALGILPETLQHIYENLPFFLPKLCLRPQEITNSPEIARRIGLMGINTALEVDIWGNVNSTHVLGSSLMNGIGGSGDFSRNCYLSIFTTPSMAKNGQISCIVPACTHVDHTEHDVQIIVTENGVADLRGHGPRERAQLVIENCAHPDFRPLLREFLQLQRQGHIGFSLDNVFAFHRAFRDDGSMQKAQFRPS